MTPSLTPLEDGRSHRSVLAARLAAVRSADVDRRELVALALPVAIPAAMTATFHLTGERLGSQLGYVAGFGIYWGTCAALSVGLLGRAGVKRLFRDRRPRLGRPAVVGWALLLWPAAGAIATRFVPEFVAASPPMIATATGIALVNSSVEEVLWRGVYVSLWPTNPWLGWIWPAVGFGAWHMAPQVIHPSPMGALAYVAAATALGLSWGWVALRTGSIRWVTVSHLLTDGSGLRNSLLFLSA